MYLNSYGDKDILKKLQKRVMEKHSMNLYLWQDEQNRKMLCSKLTTLEQELKMEKRVRRKTQKFYKSRVEASRGAMDFGKNDKTAKGKTFISH